MGIIKEFQSDLDNAAVRVVGEYRARLHAEAAKLCGDASEADDLVMRTFDAAFRDTSSYDATKGELYPWLVGVLRRIYAKTDRRLVNRGTIPVDPAVLQDLAGISEDTVDEILERSDHDALREAMNRLDPEYKKMLVMHYFGELPVKQIATVMNVPVGTVLWRLSIARKILARDLGEKLGRKPVAVLLAALLGIGTLFGAWVSPLGDWVAEKVFGSVPAVEAVSAQGVEDFSDNKQNEAPQVSDQQQVAYPQVQEGDETMNIKSAFTNTLAAAAVAAAGLAASAEEVSASVEPKPCLSLPTTWLGATSVKGDGVSFDTKLAYFQNALSVSFWVKNPTARSENGNIKYGYVVGNGAYSAKRGFAVAYQEETVGGKLIRSFNLQVKDDTAGSADPATMFNQRVVTCNDIQDGRWHHIAIVYDTVNRRIVGYYDGVAQVGERETWPGSATDYNLINMVSIGRNAENNGWAFGGELAELSLWNCALTDEQVTSILENPVSALQNQTGLLVYWKFDVGTGSSVTDATGHGNAGTIKTAANAPCTTYWGNDFDVYATKPVLATVTGYLGPEDGETHACTCTVKRPTDGYTVKWAWNDDLEDFTHDVAESFVATGTYTNRCRVTREGYKTYTGEATVVIRPTLFVATTGDDAAAGRKDSPLLTITEAIKRLGAAGGCVLLNDGTYMLEKKFDTYPFTATVDYTCGWCVQVCTPVEIIGLSHDPKKVILDAKNAQCALMVMNHPDASIRYVTLQNAYAEEKGTAGSYGGGNLRLDAGLVSDCIFRDGQTRGHGGNLWVSAGAGRVSRCVFYGGKNIVSGYELASSVFAIGDAAKGSCPIIDNSFVYGAGLGGVASLQLNYSAVTARGGARFVNCTIAGNTINAAAAYRYDNDSLFVNCAIYDNGGMDVRNPGAGFVNCATATELSGGMNCKVIAEPKFKNAAGGDYRLRQGSALIGAGDLAAYRDSAVSETDVVGNKRIRRNALSIGCYEYAPSGLIISFW